MTKYIGPKTADENVATQADKLSLSSATPDALTPDQAGAAGTATTAARSDHQHEILAGSAGTILPDDVAAEGASTSFARADHTHAITAAAPSANLTASTTNSEGTASSFARSDHSHAITTAAPGTINPDDAAATGSSASLARADHTHAIAAASAGTITGTNAEGTSTSFARADHNHAYGALSIPNSALALGPTYETSLPGSPVDGQEIYYAADATNGIIWHLRYRSGGGTYKWEFVGGSPLYKADNDVRSVTSGTFTDIPTDTIVQAVPLAGEYLVQHGANMEINPGNRTALYGYAITDANDANATNPDDRQCTILGQPVSSGAILASYNQMANVRTITTAGYKFRERAKSTFGTDTLTVYARRLVVTPIRVG